MISYVIILNAKSDFVKKLSLLLLVMIVTAMSAAAQKTLMDDGWQFVRIYGDTTFGRPPGQGSSWESQFSFETKSGQSHGTYALSDSLVRAEQKMLATAAWQDVTLPHTAYVEPLTIIHPWQGVSYYRRTLNVNSKDLTGQTWIEFEGVMQLADIWINGRHAMQHPGGFTTFVVDATPYLHEGSNTILVRADNRVNPLIPPGKPLIRLDFCYHSGIYRDVWLIRKPDLYITHPLMVHHTAGGGIFVTYPLVSDHMAEVAVQTEVGNKLTEGKQMQIRQRLFPVTGKGKGKAVAEDVKELNVPALSDATLRQTLTVRSPLLWYPDSPRLYRLETQLMQDGKVVDSETTVIGIRTFDITRQHGLRVNGRPYYLCGTNRHQEYPYVGNAISDNAHYRDVYQMRGNGFNIVRLGHYPQDPAVIDACDRLGLLAIEPIPGWQFFNDDSVFVNLTYENVRELIRRDRNHPSILMWETTLNESWPPSWWKDRAVAVAHDEMPGNQCFTSGDTYGYEGFDVCYNDWDDKAFRRPDKCSKPSFVREYYDYEFGGDNSSTRIGRRDGMNALIQNLWNAQWSYNVIRSQYPTTFGCAIWSMYDYNRGCCPSICESGVADIFRLPKLSLDFFRLQVPKGAYTPSGPMTYDLFCTAYGKNADNDTLMVYGNVDEVALSIDGKPVARRSADNGPTTSYKPAPDGGNCTHLAFPPFTFTGLRGLQGDIELTGYSHGKAVVQRTVRRPATPTHIDLTYFESGRPVTQEDDILVYVSLRDDNGTLCPVNDEPVRLTVVSGGKIEGPAERGTDAGVGSFLVSTGNARRLVIEASWKGKTVRRSYSLPRSAR